MARKFTYKKRDGTASKPLGLTGLMTVAKERVKPGAGPFTLTMDGEPLGTALSRSAVLGRLERRLKAGKVGPIYRAKNAKDVAVLQCREIKPAVEVIDTSGNRKVDTFWSALKHEFPDITFLGAYVCKPLQHGRGNAVDAGASGAKLKAMADWAYAHRDDYCLRNIIYEDRIWSRGVGWHAYTGEKHVSHAHFDFEPKCADSGPCFVDETGAC